MDPPSWPSVIDHDALLSLNPSIDVLDLERKRPCDLTDHLNQTHSSAADVIIPQFLKTDRHAIAPRSSACVCRWIHLQQQNLDFQHFFTVALDLAIEEFQPDPSNADKMRNLSRGLTRFRTERENKGVHGRSFRGGFSSFAASGQKARSLDAGGFLSLPYLCFDQLLHATTPRSSILHSPETLLQHHFRFDEYAFDEDESFLSAESGKHFLGPPMRALTVLTDELWGLCLDERTIVTSSRASAHDLWPSIPSPRSLAFKEPFINPADHLPPSMINALKDYFGDSLVIHPTNIKMNRFIYTLNGSNQISLLKPSYSSDTLWRNWRKAKASPRLSTVQLRHLNILLSYVASPNCGTSRHEILHRLQCLQTLQLSRIFDLVDEWTSTEQKVVFKGQMISYDLISCLESLWADAIHLFLNLPSIPERLPPGSFWMNIRARCFKIPTQVLVQQSGVNNTLVLPRRDGETFQDLERDLQAHITRFKIERHYLWSHRGVSKTYDFLEDIESASGSISSHCLMHAFQRAAPFRSTAEANATIQSYSRRMSIMARSARHYPSKALLHDISKTCEELEIMKGIIKTQQKAHSEIVGAIDRSLPATKSESQDRQHSETDKSPKDATERSFIGRSAWMKTVKVLEDIEQLQGEGKRLAEQTVQLVDIKVEDQGKAVMVFTIVTVIFLPLSFVSSYFGMNTADIQELQHGQWIFWAVGLSVTFCTVVIALLIAFRGQRWKRRWNEKYLWDKERGMKVL